MFQKFSNLFNALNTIALQRCDEDLSMIEETQRLIVDAWIHYMMSRTYPPSKAEIKQLTRAIDIVNRF